MNVGVAASDARRIEVLAQDLPCFGGSQLVDVTLRSALGCSGEPGTSGQGDHLPGTGGVQPVPTRCGGLGNRRQVERRGLRHLQAVGICASSGRAPIHEVACLRQLVRCPLQPHLYPLQNSVRHGAALAGRHPP